MLAYKAPTSHALFLGCADTNSKRNKAPKTRNIIVYANSLVMLLVFGGEVTIKHEHLPPQNGSLTDFDGYHGANLYFHRVDA